MLWNVLMGNNLCCILNEYIRCSACAKTWCEKCFPTKTGEYISHNLMTYTRTFTEYGEPRNFWFCPYKQNVLYLQNGVFYVDQDLRGRPTELKQFVAVQS